MDWIIRIATLLVLPATWIVIAWIYAEPRIFKSCWWIFGHCWHMLDDDDPRCELKVEPSIKHGSHVTGITFEEPRVIRWCDACYTQICCQCGKRRHYVPDYTGFT